MPRFRAAIMPLLIAPAGALAVVACLLVVGNDDLGFYGSVTLLAYLLLVCYLAELVLVVPGLAFWPRLRRPSLLNAAAYGVLVGWALPLLRFFVDGDLLGWRTFGPATVAGAVSGVICAALLRRASVSVL